MTAASGANYTAMRAQLLAAVALITLVNSAVAAEDGAVQPAGPPRTEKIEPPKPQPGSPPPTTSQAATQRNVSNEQGDEGTEFWPPIFGHRLKITDTLIALFTALLFIATFLLWVATRNLVRGADDTSQRQLRAYLGVERIQLSSQNLDAADYKPAGRFRGLVHRDFLLVTVRNFGSTPAYDVRIWVNWQTMPFAQRLPDAFEFLDRGVVSPNVPQPTLSQHILHRDQNHLAQIAIRDLRPFISTNRQERSLYVHGHIDYRDIYRRRWSATFCQSWEPWTKSGVEFIPYREHNDEREVVDA
jgi:hypothetical protein